MAGAGRCKAASAVSAPGGLDWRVGIAVVVAAALGAVAFMLSRRKEGAA